MSYKEAIADGIRIEKSNNKSTMYYPPCNQCGRETFSLSYLPNNKYICKTCKHKKISRVYENKGMARMRKS